MSRDTTVICCRKIIKFSYTQRSFPEHLHVDKLQKYVQSAILVAIKTNGLYDEKNQVKIKRHKYLSIYILIVVFSLDYHRLG